MDMVKSASKTDYLKLESLRNLNCTFFFVTCFVQHHSILYFELVTLVNFWTLTRK